MLPGVTRAFVNLKTKQSDWKDLGISYKDNFHILFPVLGKMDYEFLLEVELLFSSVVVGDSVLCLCIHDSISPVPIAKCLWSDYELFFTFKLEDFTALWQRIESPRPKFTNEVITICI